MKKALSPFFKWSHFVLNQVDVFVLAALPKGQKAERTLSLTNKIFRMTLFMGCITCRGPTNVGQSNQTKFQTLNEKILPRKTLIVISTTKWHLKVFCSA